MQKRMGLFFIAIGMAMHGAAAAKTDEEILGIICDSTQKMTEGFALMEQGLNGLQTAMLHITDNPEDIQAFAEGVGEFKAASILLLSMRKMVESECPLTSADTTKSSE